MPTEYGQRLFSSYSETHIKNLDQDDKTKQNWFRQYFKRAYEENFDLTKKSTSKILEIGCNRGYLLQAFREAGFPHLTGIDLSPDDVKMAQTRLPQAQIQCADAFKFLAENKNSYDLIIMKAVLEHTEKPRVLNLLEEIKNSLTEGGKVIVDVPNMDWLFAPHERFMDFTHEVGFTPESLRQVMNQVFRQVEIDTVDNIFYGSIFSRWKTGVARFIVGLLLRAADPETGSMPIWHRSLLGIGTK